MDKVELIKKIKAGMEFEYLFFWENQPSKRGSVGESCLSQWFPAEFTVDGIVYHCAEQNMMAEKARYFRDKETTEAILQSTSPKKIKELGRKVRNFNTERWNSVKMDIVTTGNIYKFMQNKLLRSFLLSTEDKVLVEASPYDCIWGIGLPKENPDASDPVLWQGENLLGFALMTVRHYVKNLQTFEKLLEL